MRAAIRTGQREPLRIVMTISSGSSKPNARSATRSKPNARVLPTRWPSTLQGRVSTSSRAPVEERSKRSCAVSDWPERTQTSSYRNLARDVSTLGAGSRVGVVIWSIWAYGSQARLLVWGIIAFALAFILRFLHGDTATSAIGHGNESLKPAGDWVAAHGDWFDRAAQILFILGALAIALNLWRALGFSNLLLRGSRLLTQETRERRQELEARAARLNQRVAALTAEADAAAKRAEAANQRAGGVTSMRAPGPEFLESSHAPSGAAREFLAALGAKLGQTSASGPAPDRLIVVVDNLDALSPAEAISWIDAAQGVIGPGSIGLLAFDPGRLAAALEHPSEARRRLGKWLQVAVNLPARKDADGALVVARLLSAGEHSARRRIRRSPRSLRSRCRARKRRSWRRSRLSRLIRRATPSASSTPIALRAAQICRVQLWRSCRPRPSPMTMRRRRCAIASLMDREN